MSGRVFQSLGGQFSGQALIGFCPLCELTYMKASLDNSAEHTCAVESVVEDED